MKPKGGLLIDVIAGPSSEDEEELPDEVASKDEPERAPTARDPQALLDSIQTQLDQLRMQLMG